MSRANNALIVAVLMVLAGCTSGGGTGGGSGSLGLSAGGAQDANNFRDNVANGYLPLESDVTAHGVYSEYYFDTARPRRCAELFCPSYSRGVARDPLSEETEYYLTVGLNSNLDRDEFERKRLNLVVVVDTSGSMAESFDDYYYDGATEAPSERRPKMAAAREALDGMLDHLRPGDRLGIVTYSGRSRTLVEMGAVGERDMEAVRADVASLAAGGSTNLAAGMDRAREMVAPYAGADPSVYETRIVYLTDAMPNVGDTSAGGLGDRLRWDADRGVYSTFVGVGVDFNTRLVEAISGVEGANYYAVHSAATFERRLDREFEYMVTPMVFDLTLALESEGYEIERVYGAPDADEATGELLHVDTLFPAPTRNGSTKGGVVLVELERTGGPTNVTVEATYENRSGVRQRTVRSVTFERSGPPHYDTSGVRKAIVLSRYADLMGNWVAYERGCLADGSPAPPGEGIEPHEDRDLGQWERQSAELRVSDRYRPRLRRFLAYFRAEARALGDESLRREERVLERLLAVGVETATAGDEMGADSDGTATGGNETATESNGPAMDTDWSAMDTDRSAIGSDVTAMVSDERATSSEAAATAPPAAAG